MYGLNKYMIDITIETLAGTKFSLKVSKLDKIQSIKLKIQRHEGIPVSHQHLIWQSNELEDQCSLNDYNIPNGATLKMVLALRGGPINTRRINTEDIYDLMEIQEDSNQWNNETAQSVNKHVTLVFYKDGDRYSFFKIIDRADAASPTSGAMSAASMYVPYDETEQDPSGGQGGGATTSAATTLTDGLASLLNKSATAKSSKFVPRRRKSAVNENRKTKEKMNAIKNRLSQHRKQIQQQQQQKQEQNSINPEAAKATDSSNDTKTTTSESSTQSALNGFQVQNEPLTNVKRPSSAKTNVRETELVQNDPQSQKRTEVVNENGYKFYDDDDDEDRTISDQENCYQEYVEDDDEDDDDQEGEVDDEDEDEYDDDEEVDEEDEYDEDEDEYDDQEDEEDDDDDEDEENEVVEDDDYGPSHGEPSAQENYLSQSCENVNGMTNNSELNEFDQSAGAATTATIPTATNNEDENEVDDDENELLLNKSEFLLNEDVHQINNSPTGGLTNTDLMAIMMMTVNSDQISLNGVSSSLATTALPTVLTPIYTTDNENFFIPYSSGSAGTRSKYIRKSNKYKNANKLNRTRNRKLVTDTEQAPDALAQQNSTNLDEASLKMMQKQYRQKQKKRKRQLLANQANQVEPETGEDPNTAEQAKITDKPIVANRRKPIRKRNSDLKPSDLQQIASAAVAFSPTAILLRTISFENSRKLIKESNQRRLKRIDQIQQPIDQTETTTEKSDEPSSEEAKQESNSPNQENETETNVKPKETINSSVTSLRKITSAIANPNRTISGSTKRVSFTVDDESDAKAAESTVNATTASGEQKSTAERENKLTMSRNTSMLDALNENTTTNGSSSSPVANAPPTITTGSVLVASENTTTSANRPPIIKSTVKQQQPYMSTFDENVAGYNQIKNHLKPSVWANYRQKPPPKLDSLYHQTHQDINMQATTTAVKSMDKHVESSLNVNENLLTKSHPNSYNYNTKHTPPSTNLQIPQQSASSNTGLATATTTYSDYSKPLLNARRSQPDSGSSVNKLEAFKNNLGPSSILKTYQNSNSNQNSASIYANNTNNIRNSIVENNNNSGNLTSTIEITRILSGSSNNRMSRQYSISSNDLAQSQQQQQQQQITSKPLKLPPVNSNLNKPDTAGSSLLIGGSTNNINSIGLNDTTSIPIKKFNDLSRYCNFCRKKTGLASSYICRCGNNYCTQHRNAEAHNCTYDYKTEGRKLIEQSNPLVAASKLPKI